MSFLTAGPEETRAWTIKIGTNAVNAAGASPDGTIGEDHHPETHLIPLILQAAAVDGDCRESGS